MTKAFKIGIGNLLLEFLAHTLVFLCTLNSARAVTACPLQALFNCLYCFFVGIKCYFHLLTPQFLRRLPLISSLDYTIYRNPKIVKRRCVTAPRSYRQSDIVKTTTPEICFVLILPHAYECLALSSWRGTPCSPFVLCANIKQTVGAFIGRPPWWNYLFYVYVMMWWKLCILM